MRAEWTEIFQLSIFALFGIITLFQWRAENRFLSYLRSHHENLWRLLVPHPSLERLARWKIQWRLSRLCWWSSQLRKAGDPLVLRLSRQRKAFEVIDAVLIVALMSPSWLR